MPSSNLGQCEVVTRSCQYFGKGDLAKPSRRSHRVHLRYCRQLNIAGEEQEKEYLSRSAHGGTPYLC